MTRQHKPHSNAKVPKKNNQRVNKKPSSLGISLWKKIMTAVVLVIAACIAYMGYLETRVNTPFDNAKMVTKPGLETPDRYWGSYRPGVYFGLKTRDPHSLVTGLMWYFPQNLAQDGSGLRHWCEEGDNLGMYSWVQHDGKNFGVQEIQDGPFLLTTSFVKTAGGSHGGDWTARIAVDSPASLHGQTISVMFYTAIEDKTNGFIKPIHPKNQLTGVSGRTEGLGGFSIKLFNISGYIDYTSYLSTVTEGLHKLKETVMGSLRLSTDPDMSRKRIVLPGELFPPTVKEEPNFIVTKVSGTVPLVIDVVFESGSFVHRKEIVYGDTYTKLLKEHVNNFHDRFEDTFLLKQKGFNDSEILFAERVFSNLIGGIGYFYGQSRVESANTKGPVPYWKAPLYTAVPSRSFFPRGFLWDEGFHGILISAWDLDIELDIICHWFDLMNVEGWIPREQILGLEALSKVPEEFVVQRNTNANPPTFFLTLQFILENYLPVIVEKNEYFFLLERLFPRLQAWFNWFNTTQVGDLPGSYRWRGRDSSTNLELNPKTLTSGLDDYPRASHPNIDERHVDLRCWIALASSAMLEISKLVNENPDKYSNTYAYLTEESLLDHLHWSSISERFVDYGLHTDAVTLERPPPPKSQSRHSAPRSTEKVRVVLKDPELRFVDSHFGYVSLFPFLLKLLDPNSPKLGKLLTDLRKPELLWTNFGLRSLAKNSPMYQLRNTEHDPPYWRGSIWININYLAVRALHYYGTQEGLHKEAAMKLYKELRQNLIRNMYKEYRRSGYVWEQYNDKTGHGLRSHPFTGWSSLVVMMMAELY